ncbi:MULTISPECIES: (Fe-S)-binding protein [unclassified Pseudodesulfovibrio]|uniref:(Fe-S)-binding protein n=1 Tax=unclassified Pseudodesulfovibrio TaxID=2661612 RepID=UPI000FEB7A83|nr:MULTISPECIES: (Fe-S)-binding protein [unclassified Pseudodesulfovibrio]MCJ2165020.1 (Fe-S)-binding protein [Pseudodesulfovibrio sp. S3-i]RWU03540.1 (Fe-S)-binding protein [Pseudodesulfovibrio sp. S3]
MADIHKLAQLFKELDDQLVGCMRCGMCQAVCPIFAESGREADVTRGKLALLDGLAQEMISDPEGVNEKLNRCLLCGTCQSNCPSGVSVMDIFLKARAIMTGYFGLSPAKKAIFRGLLKNPKLFNTLTDMGAKFQGLFTKKVDDMLGSSCARFNAPIIGDRHFNTLAGKPLHKLVPELDTPAGKSGIRVALYVGCVIDKIYPQVGEAILKVLKHHGVGVFMPTGQACCGIPALSSGDTDTFDTLVGLNVDTFAKGEFDYLVTGCATCTSTIKELWPRMYKGDSARKYDIGVLERKTMDISQFLVDILKVKPGEMTGGQPVTYHDPCHLKNSLGITAQPRTLIKAAGCDFKEMADAGTCCGCGGSFNIAHYDISKKIGSHKADNIMASGAKVAATSCPACMLQITDMLSQKEAGMGVKHVIELYADSLRG